MASVSLAAYLAHHALGSHAMLMAVWLVGKRLFELKDEFAQKAVARIKELKYGDPSDEDTQIACLISEKAAIKVEKEVNLTVQQGGKILFGGKRNGAFYDPTVIVD